MGRGTLVWRAADKVGEWRWRLEGYTRIFLLLRRVPLRFAAGLFVFSARHFLPETTDAWTFVFVFHFLGCRGCFGLVDELADRPACILVPTIQHLLLILFEAQTGGCTPVSFKSGLESGNDTYCMSIILPELP